MTHTEHFDVSVVISTYNRCDLLPDALEAVLSQKTDGVRYEIIIVDNNSTDRTRNVVEPFAARSDGKLRYIFEGRQGLSYGRNAGINNARAPIIAFTDDDVRVAPDWVKQIKLAFDAHPDADFVSGKILPRWEREPPRWLTREHWTPLAITDHGDKPFYVDAKNPLCLIGASLAFRRAVFDRIGLFAPDLQRVKDGIGSTEDHELQLRLWYAGGRGMYVPEIVVYTDVQAERLEKSYHRRWYTGYGRYCAMMHLIEITGPDGELIHEPPNPTKLFGTPAYIYRMLIPLCGQWLKATARRRESVAFHKELELRRLLSYIRKRYEENAAARQRSPIAELGSFAITMLRRKVGSIS
jgi:glycosyltransferase involved in cell wall biosynthesis